MFLFRVDMEKSHIMEHIIRRVSESEPQKHKVLTTYQKSKNTVFDPACGIYNLFSERPHRFRRIRLSSNGY